MTPERWERVAEIFGDALDVPAGDRERLAGERCGADAMLHEAVMRLLKHHQRADGFLEQPAGLSSADCRYVFGPGDAFHPGDLIAGRYRLDAELGTGAAGVVWKASDSRLDGKPVAIKLMHPYWLSTRWMRMRFGREMRALARLRHPNTVSVLDYEETGPGQAFLVMELVEGETLRAWLSRSRPTSEEVVNIIRQIAEVIDAAHARGVLHRDLKPENIMVTAANAVKVLDFGVARVTEPDENGGAHSSILAGTPGYMAPEQVFGRTTEASDRFSLGAIAFEMLAGRRPFARANPSEMLDEKKRRVAVSLRELRPDLPAEAGLVIASMLRLEPEGRPPSGRAFAASLESALRSPPRRRPTRRQFAAGGAGILLSASAACVLADQNGWVQLSPAESRFQWDVSRDLVDAPGNPAFKPVGDIADTLVWGPSGRRDLVRLRSGGVGFYDHSLTDRQRRRAWRHGWVLRTSLLALEGSAFVTMNMVDFGPRLDVGVSVHSSGGSLIELPDAIVPEIRGVSIVVPRTGDSLLHIEMRFDGGSKTAQVLVDGKQVADAYRGHMQYQTNEGRKPGLFIGVGTYSGSARGIGVFGDVALQIL